VDRHGAQREERQGAMDVHERGRAPRAHRPRRDQQPEEDGRGEEPVGDEARGPRDDPERGVAGHDVRVIVSGGRVTTLTAGADAEAGAAAALAARRAAASAWSWRRPAAAISRRRRASRVR
jgi:hypothetical protein